MKLLQWGSALPAPFWIFSQDCLFKRSHQFLGKELVLASFPMKRQPSYQGFSHSSVQSCPKVGKGTRARIEWVGVWKLD